MTVYFLRHGESEANLAKLFAGQKEDSPLTQLGINQAHLASAELAKLKIDKIICSHLVRAQETARIVAEAIGVTDIEIDDRIIEYDMGGLSGTRHHKITSLELTSADGAEDTAAFQARVLSLLRDVMHSEQNVLLVSHAGVGRIIEAAKQGISPNLFYDIDGYPNAHPVQLELAWLK